VTKSVAIFACTKQHEQQQQIYEKETFAKQKPTVKNIMTDLLNNIRCKNKNQKRTEINV
jgi:hypothetical protein